jgi:FkbM family methyltransferase
VNTRDIIADLVPPIALRAAQTAWRRLRGSGGHTFDGRSPNGNGQRNRYRSKSGFIFTDMICAALPPGERFTILDGGPREVADDPRWRGHEDRRLRFYGFEIDAVECARLNSGQRSDIERRYFPIGLWSDRDRRTFYVTASSGGCSLFPINHALTDRWKMQNPTSIFLVREAMRVERTEIVDVDTLDNVARKYHFAPIDFMKLNVQGAELAILKGASKVLPATLGLQVEVSFVESYIGRPLFADVDTFLRNCGFSYFDIIGQDYLGRERSPVTVRHLHALDDIMHGQCIEGHAVYFRDPIDIERKGGDLSWANQVTLLKLASLAEVYHQIEFAAELLDWSTWFLAKQDDRVGGDTAKKIVKTGVDKYLRYMK